MMNPLWTNAYEAYNTSSIDENISIFDTSFIDMTHPWIKAFEAYDTSFIDTSVSNA